MKIDYSYITAITANLISFVVGTSLSWTSPVLFKFDIKNITDSDEYPFDEILTDTQTSLISSFLALGAVFGPVVFGIIVDKIGRKITLLSLGVPFIAAYLILAFAKLVELYYVARLMVGFAVGGVFTVMPMYTAEIAHNNNRGALSSMMNVLLCLGLLASYSIGPYIPLVVYNIILAIIPGVYMVLFFIFGPESPHYYVAKGDQDSAKLSLEKLRGVSDNNEKELEEIKLAIEKAGHGTYSDLFKSRGLIKALIISNALVGLQQLSGINAVLFFAQPIFKAAGSDLEPAICAIIIGLVQFSTSFITPILSDKLGRKILLLFSAIGMLISEVPLGVYFYLSDNGTDVSGISFLPILTLVTYIITYNSGFGPLPWTVTGELFPTQVKSVAGMITASFCWFLGFIVTMFFKSIAEELGMGQSFWIFAGFCGVATLFLIFVVFETKGKSLQEIQDILGV